MALTVAASPPVVMWTSWSATATAAHIVECFPSWWRGAGRQVRLYSYTYTHSESWRLGVEVEVEGRGRGRGGGVVLTAVGKLLLWAGVLGDMIQ